MVARADRDQQGFGGAGASRASAGAGARSNTSGGGANAAAGAAMQRALVSTGDTWATQVQRGLNVGENGTISVGTDGRPTIGPSQNDGPGPVTSYGAPIHTVAPGNIYGGIQAAKSPAAWSALNDQVNTYNNAARGWNATTGRSFGNFVNAASPMGLSMEPPDFNRPATYTGGDYHLGVNPAKMAASLLGAYGSSLLTGPLAGNLYTKAGGKDLMLSGPAAPASWALNGTGQSPGGPQLAQAAPNHMATFGNPTQGGGMGGLPNPVATIPGGAPFGPQPSAPSLGTPAPAFPGGVPNHTLPQGYNSMFPNSLTDQDKALLYAKALGGGMG